MFKLDKTVFKKQSFEKADKTKDYWLSKTIDERLEATLYLQSVIYGFDLKNLPRMNKSFVGATKRNT